MRRKLKWRAWQAAEARQGVRTTASQWQVVWVVFPQLPSPPRSTSLAASPTTTTFTTHPSTRTLESLTAWHPLLSTSTPLSLDHRLSVVPSFDSGIVCFCRPSPVSPLVSVIARGTRALDQPLPTPPYELLQSSVAPAPFPPLHPPCRVSSCPAELGVLCCAFSPCLPRALPCQTLPTSPTPECKSPRLPARTSHPLVLARRGSSSSLRARVTWLVRTSEASSGRPRCIPTR